MESTYTAYLTFDAAEDCDEDDYYGEETFIAESHYLAALKATQFYDTNLDDEMALKVIDEDGKVVRFDVRITRETSYSITPV